MLYNNKFVLKQIDILCSFKITLVQIDISIWYKVVFLHCKGNKTTWWWRECRASITCNAMNCGKGKGVLAGVTWSCCFLLGNTNDGLIDCHHLQAIRCKQAKQLENSCLVLHMISCFIHPTHSDNAANEIWLRKRFDAIWYIFWVSMPPDNVV